MTKSTFHVQNIEHRH